MKSWRREWAFAFVVASACGGSSSKHNPDAAVDVPPDVATRMVTGKLDITFVTSNGDVVQAPSLDGVSVSAISAADFSTYPGAAGTGTFSIPGVPVGPCYLKFGTTYFVMSEDTVDLSFTVLGRPNDGFANSSTPLTLNMTGLTSWQTTDELALFSVGSGTAAYEMQAVASAGVPAASDTSLTGFTYDLSFADDRALIDTTMGDQPLVTHLATQSDGTRSFQTIVESYSPTPFTITNGATATISGAFGAVAQSSTLDAMWDRPAFAAELTAHSPGSAQYNWSTFAITALPEAATHGVYGDGPDVVVFAPGYLTDSTAVNAMWSYGDPYPAGWTRYAWCRYYRYRYIQPAGLTAVAIFSELLAYRDLSTLTAQAPLEPIVGVPIAPTINGGPAFGTALISGVTTTPRIAWGAPALGTAAKYYVGVDLVTAQSGQTVLQREAELETTDTQIVIPPGILTQGQTYVFVIEARSVMGVDLEATPEASSLPQGWGSVTTTMVTP